MERSASKAMRMLDILRILATRPYQASELSERLKVDRRTIQRDIKALFDLGFKIEQSGYSYSIKERGLQLNRVELLALYSATRLLVHHARFKDTHYQDVLNKLAKDLPEHVKVGLQRSAEAMTGLGSEQGRTFEIVAHSWFDRQVLQFDYQKGKGSEIRRFELEVYFYEISRVNLLAYAIGRERKSGQLRTFKLSRMSRCELKDEPYSIPADFDPDAHLSSAWGIVGGDGVTIRLWVHKDVALQMHEVTNKNFAVESDLPDGHLIARLEVGRARGGRPIEAISWILGWGSKVKVIEPEEVRLEIKRELEGALGNYS